MKTMQRPAPGANSTLLQRLEWIIEVNTWTHEQFSKAAGFANRTHVSAILHRLRRNPDFAKHMGINQYEKLSKGAGVSLIWLEHGMGDPYNTNVKISSRFPNLDRIVREERDRWSQHTIAAASTMPWEHDQSPLEWMAILDMLERTLAADIKRIQEH